VFHTKSAFYAHTGKKPARILHPGYPISRESRDTLILDFLELLDSPRALSVWLLYKSGEHRQIVELVCNPSDYMSVDLFRRDYAAVKFLSKAIGLKTGINLTEVAIKSAAEAELECSLTNDFIKEVRNGNVSSLYGKEWFLASQKIAAILGDLPPFDRLFVDGDVGWSPGRTSSCSGNEISPYEKYRGRPDVTRSARNYALRMLRESPWWGASVLEADNPCSVLPSALPIVHGNTMITVPKSAKTERVICYEPHMNIRLQLAVGSHIRHRLLKHGVDLSDQSINRRRARVASFTGHLATIDLKSASDTIALELVYDLLPLDWALLLDDLRSKNTLWPDGVVRRNEKFSSMGNGYTFEVESLIFYALASVVAENVSVFGDDLIVDAASYGRVVALLRSCGFTINSRKSFSSGEFRESCGGDYFRGYDCTPVYLRRLPRNVEDVLKLHNRIREFASRDVSPELKFARVLAKWRRNFPCHLGPDGSGDGCYHVNFEEARPQRAANWIDGWYYRTFVWLARNHSKKEPDNVGAALSAALGPKKVRNLLSIVNPGRGSWVVTKEPQLASFVWPAVVWT
jgi:hypothetical protein